MAYDNEKLNQIFAKTDGCCHICYKKLVFTNYGVYDARGNWHVEHSKPRAKGGSNHLNNLYAACIGCNSEKSTYHTKTARGWYGKTRAPFNVATKRKLREENTIGGAVIGGIIGSLLGPAGTIIGASIGGVIGNSNSPRR